jgi:hypothetical protein
LNSGSFHASFEAPGLRFQRMFGNRRYSLSRGVLILIRGSLWSLGNNGFDDSAMFSAKLFNGRAL